jgi:hypothetical protein
MSRSRSPSTLDVPVGLACGQGVAIRTWPCASVLAGWSRSSSGPDERAQCGRLGRDSPVQQTTARVLVGGIVVAGGVERQQGAVAFGWSETTSN